MNTRTNTNLDNRIISIIQANGGTPAYIPAGGTTGQAIVKNSDNDYDLKWSNISVNSEGRVEVFAGYDITDFGVRGGGIGRALNLTYASLADAQVKFPNARSLDEQENDLGFQLAVDFVLYNPEAKSIKLFAPLDNYVFNRPQHFGYGYSFKKTPTSQVIHWGAIEFDGKGSTFTFSNPDNAGFFTQGLRGSKFENFTVVGRNGGIPKNGGVYGTNATKQENYLTPYPNVGIDYEEGVNRYNPYSGIVIDGFSDLQASASGLPSYATPDISLSPYFTSFKEIDGSDVVWGTSYKWMRNESSQIQYNYVNCTQFICGLAIQPNGSGRGNADFIRFNHCNFGFNMYGVSASGSQMRLTTFDYCSIDANFIGVTVGIHGEQRGNIKEFNYCHFSGGTLFHASQMDWNGGLVFNGCYSESLYRLGTFGYAGLGIKHATVIINNCNFRFGHGEMDSTPTNIMSGPVVIHSTNSYFEGNTLDMFITGGLSVIDGGGLTLTNSFQWDHYPEAHFNNHYDDIYTKLRNNPFIYGSPEGIELRGDVKVNIGGSGYFESSWSNKGANIASKRREFKFVQGGKTGLANDYMWTNMNSKGNSNGYIGLNVTWVNEAEIEFDVAALSGSLEFNPKTEIGDLMNKGDYIFVRATGVPFIIISKTGTVCRAIIKGGYDYIGGSGNRQLTNKHFEESYLQTPGLEWYWVSNNHIDTLPMNGTISGSTISNIVDQGFFDYAGSPESDFKVGSPLYMYSYAEGLPDIPTSKWELNTVASVDSVNHTITLKYPSSSTGKKQIISKNPYI